MKERLSSSSGRDDVNRVENTPCDDQHDENDDEGAKWIDVVAVRVV